MKTKITTLTVLLLLFFQCLTLVAQDRRIAIVIGNSAYPGGSALKNPINDANLMASTLGDIGFEVMKYTDATKSQMDRAIYEFSRKLSDFDVTLFYYAGHGIQVDGTNYLVPTDATLDDKLAAEFEAVDVNKVVRQFERQRDNVNIVILDACRNDPFRSWSRGGDRGFVAMPAPSGTMIAFATSAGSTAADGDGANGLYTSKLVEQIKKPQRIEDVFIQTRVEVQNASNGAQSPQEWSQLTEKFFFVEGNMTDATPSLGSAVNTTQYGSIEIESHIDGILYLDGQPLGRVSAFTKNPINDVAVGSHQLEIRSNQNVWKSETYVSASEISRLIAKIDAETVNLRNKELGEEFLEQNAKRFGVMTLTSGLQYEVIKSGDSSGQRPGLTSKVTTHYVGSLIDGQVFDSSIQRGTPATFGVNQLIPGFTEILQLMVPGDKWKVYIPSNLAYGPRPAGALIKPYSVLIFELELISVE